MATTTGYRPVSRLPDPGPRGPRAGERLRALLALLALLVLLVGIPAGLVMFVGNPLPSSLPDRAWLTASISTTFVIDLLACVVWVVWAHFVVCVISEWSTARRGRMPSTVPFGGGSQLVARRLVAALLLLAGAATLAPSTPAPADRAPATISASVQSGTPQAQVADDVAADAAAPGQQVVHYEVTPPEGRNHDCLWDIAERTLGDPLRYKEIFELNQDRVQPDGRRLVDADLIHPGWVLVLPADATGPGTVRTEPVRMSTIAGQLSLADQTAAQTVDTTTTDTTADTVAAETADGLQAPDLTHTMVGGALLLAGLALALKSRRGAYGEPEAGDVKLRLAGDATLSNLLDAALRHLSAAQTDAGRPLPEVLLAFLTPQEVVLHLAAAAHEAPAPWTVTDEGRSWAVTAAAVEGLGAVPADVAAPYPGLVNVATTHGYEVLVDLEAAPGLISVGGEDSVAREVVTSMAVELASNGWSDGVRVSLVGFGDELVGLAPHALQQFDRLEDVLRHAEAEGDQFAGLLASLGVSGVLSGREVRGAQRWRPHVLVLSAPPTPEEAVRLQAVTGNGRTPVAVVSVGDANSARWRFVAAPDGTLDLGVLGLGGQARRLPHEEYREVLALMRSADASAAREGRAAAAMSPAGAATARGPVAPAVVAPAVVVRLLGPVQVEILSSGATTGSGATPASGLSAVGNLPLLTEVVVAAALHREGLHDATLRSAVWPRGVGDDVVERTIGEVQAWLGRDRTGRPRLDRGDDGRWRLAADVGTDRDAFAALAANATGDREVADLRTALTMGRGEVFSGVPASRYAWLTFHRAARDTRVLVTATARRLSALGAAAGDTRLARDALHEGLGMVPTAESLWRDLMLLDGGDSPHAAAALASQMYGTLAFHGVPMPEPETDALVDSLAPGLRPRTA